MEANKKDIRGIVEKGGIYNNVSGKYTVAKRLIDIIGSLAGILIFCPLLIAVVIIIRIFTSGPIFYMQQRYGLKGSIFKDYRFRTTVDLNKSSMNKNLRMPRVVRLISLYRIDRLPRLFNVLKGDMSLVGPRAPLITETNSYDTWYNLRFSVKPGLTGLWQISGRMNTEIEEMVRLDLKYIRERSFRYDMKILLKTIIFLCRKRAFWSSAAARADEKP